MGQGGPRQTQDWSCIASGTGGVGYDGTTKICNYTCSSQGKTCNFNGPGEADNGYGSNCFGVPYGMTLGANGKWTSHPYDSGPQSFPVRTTGVGGAV